jgi:hypothetical protein
MLVYAFVINYSKVTKGLYHYFLCSDKKGNNRSPVGDIYLTLHNPLKFHLLQAFGSNFLHVLNQNRGVLFFVELDPVIQIIMLSAFSSVYVKIHSANSHYIQIYSA